MVLEYEIKLFMKNIFYLSFIYFEYQFTFLKLLSDKYFHSITFIFIFDSSLITIYHYISIHKINYLKIFFYLLKVLKEFG